MARTRRSRVLEDSAAVHGTHPWGAHPDGRLQFWIHHPKAVRRNNFDLSMLSLFVTDADGAAIVLMRLLACGSIRTATGTLQELHRAAKYFKANHRELMPFDSGAHQPSLFAEWENACRSFAHMVMVDAGEKQRTAGQRLVSFNRAMNCLSRNGFIPGFLNLITGKRNRNETSTARDSLLEQVRIPATNSIGNGPDKSVIQTAIAEMQLLLPPEDREPLADLLMTLALNLRGPVPRTADEMIDALRRLSNECVTTLSNLAAMQFKNWETNLFDPLEVLSSEQLDHLELFASAFGGNKKHQSLFLRIVRKNPKAFVPVLLTYFYKYDNGYAPGEQSIKAARYFLEKVYATIITRQEINSRLNLTPMCVCAALVLILLTCPVSPRH